MNGNNAIILELVIEIKNSGYLKLNINNSILGNDINYIYKQLLDFFYDKTNFFKIFVTFLILHLVFKFIWTTVSAYKTLTA